MAATGRPGLDIGTHGSISKRELEPGVWQAATRYRDERGTVRRVRARGRSSAAAERALKRKLGDLQSQVRSAGRWLVSARRCPSFVVTTRGCTVDRRRCPSLRVVVRGCTWLCRYRRCL